MYDSLMEQQLPALPFTDEEMRKPSLPWDQHMAAIREVNAKRAVAKQKIERKTVIAGVGEISTFSRPRAKPVTFFKTIFGGHNRIILDETVIDVLRDTLHL